MREETAAALRLLIVRVLCSIPFLAAAAYLFIPVSYRSILGAVLLVPPGVLLARPVNDLLFSRTGDLLFPMSENGREELQLSIPEALIMQRKYDEAMELYREIQKKHPNRIEIYIAMLKLTHGKLDNREMAADIFSLGMGNLKDLRDRERLADCHRDLQGRERW